MTSAMGRRTQLLARSVPALVAAVVALVMFVLVATDAALIVVWLGVPLLVWKLGIVRRLAEQRRAALAREHGRPFPSPYLQLPEGGPIDRIGALAADPAVRRDMLWLFVEGTLGLALSIISIVEGVLDIVFWWLPVGLAARLHDRVDIALLSVSEKSRLALRVEQLTESRAETVDTQAAELRRIERDLHDGAQARLVAIGMSLGLAENQFEQDPELARTLITEARDTANDALADLRVLVRGIHPPMLADRGFIEAIRAVAAGLPIPVEVCAEVEGRIPAAVESAAYFVIAEALTNVLKHAQARTATVALVRDDQSLRLTVRDDGRGGAHLGTGTGLPGIARRLRAFDGALTVESPAGGPTKIVMVLPCPRSESSSGKTLPSSGTG